MCFERDTSADFVNYIFIEQYQAIIEKFPFEDLLLGASGSNLTSHLLFTFLCSLCVSVSACMCVLVVFTILTFHLFQTKVGEFRENGNSE